MPPNPILEKIRKSQILDAALRIVAQQGINSVTLDDVAKASGLSKGGLVHYFPSKDTLFREVFKEFFNRIFTRGRETMNLCHDPLEKLLSFCWILDRDDPDTRIGYPLLFDGMALAAHDPEYVSMFRDWFVNWVVMLKEALKEGVEAGQFAVDDLDGTARMISAMYQGAATRWYLDPQIHPTEWAVSFVRLAVTRLVGFDSAEGRGAVSAQNKTTIGKTPAGVTSRSRERKKATGRDSGNASPRDATGTAPEWRDDEVPLR